MLKSSTIQSQNPHPNPTNSSIKQSLKQLSGNILFVDDNIVNQRLGKGMLSKLGLEFEFAANGQEALNARKIKKFSLILMDCQMPVMDGYEAARQIRQFEAETGKSRIAIIALTANAMQSDRDKCIATGMDDYLAKPYSIQDLLTILSRWLDSPNTIAEPREKFECSQESNKESQSDVIDIPKFEETKQMMAENMSLIIDAFVESGKTHIATMKQHLKSDKKKEFGLAIHAFKGSCGMLGAQRLFELCKNTEDKFHLGNTDDMDSRVEEISRLFDSSCSAIRLLMSKAET